MSSRAEASRAGGSVLAPDVSSLANVDLLPDTDCGFESRFSLNAPPALADSAARESEAMGPAPSWIGFRDSGSDVCYIIIRQDTYTQA